MWGWVLPVLMVVGVMAQPAAATVLPGGGPAKSDCYVTLKTSGTSAATDPKKLECTEGDPTCDTDGCGNGQCTIGDVSVCINQAGLTGCTPPAALTALTVKKSALAIPGSLTGSGCGAFVDEALPLLIKKGKERPSRPLTFRVTAKATGSKPPSDKDSFTLRCVPRTTACPTTTTAPPTTSTSTSTSTSLAPTTTTSTTSTSTSTSIATTSTTETTTSTAQPTTSTTESTTSTTETTTSTAQPTTSTTESTTSTTESTTTTSTTICLLLGPGQACTAGAECCSNLCNSNVCQ